MFDMEQRSALFVLYDAERRFRRACEQISLLDDKLFRYERSKRKSQDQRFSLTNERSLCNNILRMQTAIAVRTLYKEYALKTARQIAELRDLVYNQELHSILPTESSDGLHSSVDVVYDRV